WLERHREQGRVQQFRDLPDAESRLEAARRIMAKRPLTDEERQALGLDYLDHNTLQIGPTTVISVPTWLHDSVYALSDGIIQGTGGLMQTAANVLRLSSWFPTPLNLILRGVGIDPNEYAARLLERGRAGADEAAFLTHVTGAEGLGYDVLRTVGAALPGLL